MREAYRLNQHLWNRRPDQDGIDAVWMYSGKASERPTLARVESSIASLMKKAINTAP
jgi:hypothetical protein